MTREAIVDLFARREKAMNDRDEDALAAQFAEDAVVESPLGGTHHGRAAIRDVFRAFFDAFSDATITTDELIIDGDRVVHVFTMSGTDTGGLMGLAPSGKPALLPMIFVSRVSDGSITHERRIYDFTGMLMQVGVLKARPA
jgi:steroid delta-isomerase-like uncharacterized protein